MTFVLFLIGSYSASFLLPGSILILLLSVFVLMREVWLGKFKVVWGAPVIILCLVFFLFLLMRLAFLKYVILPPYSDSPIHYRIISQFLTPQTESDLNLSIRNIFSNYYHFGFHAIAAWLVLVSGISIENAITFVGQMFLVIAPISVALFAYSAVQDKYGTLFAGLMAAIGWSMPAFSVNWGKYPALSSLSVAPAVAAIALVYQYGNARNLKKSFWLLPLLIGVVLLHTRILISVLLAGIAFYIAEKVVIDKKLGNHQIFLFSILYIVALLPFRSLLIGFYSEVFSLIIFLCFLPFAIQRFPRLYIGIFLYTIALWVTWLGSAYLLGPEKSLLDEQYIEMMLYIPFSVLAGAGFAGILNRVSQNRVYWWLIFVGAIVMVWGHFTLVGPIYPDSCCDYFKEGDRMAFAWIKDNAPENSLFLISVFEDQGRSVGTDAGIWIHELTGRPTNNVPFDTDWMNPTEIQAACSSQAKNIFVYSGGREFSFQNERLNNSNKSLQPVFQSGTSRIYRIVDCPL
jgi:hypothetical protein